MSSAERWVGARHGSLGDSLLVDELSEAIDSAARILVESRHVVALAGAGLSAESGIPTFRGPGGLWTRLGEPTDAVRPVTVTLPAFRTGISTTKC